MWDAFFSLFHNLLDVLLLWLCPGFKTSGIKSMNDSGVASVRVLVVFLVVPRCLLAQQQVNTNSIAAISRLRCIHLIVNV